MTHKSRIVPQINESHPPASSFRPEAPLEPKSESVPRCWAMLAIDVAPAAVLVALEEEVGVGPKEKRSEKSEAGLAAAGAFPRVVLWVTVEEAAGVE